MDSYIFSFSLKWLLFCPGIFATMVYLTCPNLEFCFDLWHISSWPLSLTLHNLFWLCVQTHLHLSERISSSLWFYLSFVPPEIIFVPDSHLTSQPETEYSSTIINSSSFLLGFFRLFSRRSSSQHHKTPLYWSLLLSVVLFKLCVTWGNWKSHLKYIFLGLTPKNSDI